MHFFGQQRADLGKCAHGRTVRRSVRRSAGPRSAVRPNADDGDEFARPLHRARVDVQRIDCSSAHVCMVCAVAVGGCCHSPSFWFAEQQQFVHARDQLLGLVGCGVVIGYASYVLAGEPAHEAAHPFYNVRTKWGERAEG